MINLYDNKLYEVYILDMLKENLIDDTDVMFMKISGKLSFVEKECIGVIKINVFYGVEDIGILFLNERRELIGYESFTISKDEAILRIIKKIARENLIYTCNYSIEEFIDSEQKYDHKFIIKINTRPNEVTHCFFLETKSEKFSDYKIKEVKAV